MTIRPRQLEYRRLRAPRGDRTALIEPSLDAVSAMVDANVRLAAERDYDVQGVSLRELSRQARDELLAEAVRWTSAYRDISALSDRSGPIFLAGHQPQLFHPGVWLKNFVLDHVACRQGAVAVNLLIDSDTVKSTLVRLPTGTPAEPRAVSIGLDRSEPRVPYEERRIVDREQFARFGRHVAEQVAGLVPDPLINTYWPMVRHRAEQTENLGSCLAQARDQLEARWGSQTLQVPQSRICRTASFCRFVAHLLAQLPRFSDAYNRSVREYRRVHRIRSTAHPVPDLVVLGEWFEAPFWVWTSEDPHRRALFVRSAGDRLVLSDRRNIQFDLPLTADGDATRAVERLMELAADETNHRGVKIRSRALITTLWARLVLGDLFIHGIGGAKYDQVTDLLIGRFFGLVPPDFMVVSATLHLPIARRPIARRRTTPADARAIRQQLRRLTYHPECFADPSQSPLGTDASLSELIEAKRHWIRTPQTAENARTRYGRIRQLNEALQPWVATQREELLRRQEETARALRVEDVLGRREYGFCLYPEKTFRNFLDALLPKIS
ncbi:MAG: hypothetical protein V3R99_09395 [Thermoguttaceae bacterium]